MSTDRAALDESIRILMAWWQMNCFPTKTATDAERLHIQRVCDAAQAHLDTLPKTKMVEVKRWVAFDHEYDGEHLITRLRAFATEQDSPRGQWVTFNVEVPA